MDQPKIHEANEGELDLSEALEFACDIAKKAAALVLAKRAEGKLSPEPKNRERSNIVTVADRASEELITAEIKEKYPDHAIRGEEGADHKGSSGYEWIIDPIDGTLNFFEGRPFSISIGLVQDGKPVAGVLHFPDDETTLSAIAGKGAYKNGTKLQRDQHVAAADARVGFDVSSGGDENKETQKYRRPLEGKVASVERPFCCTWAARKIVEGSYDAYLCGGGLTPYDLAAAMVILREAGCAIEGMNDDIDLERAKNPVIMATDHSLLEYIQTHITLAPDKQKFFAGLAHKYRNEMRVLFQGGHLYKKDGWRNVAEHCLMEAAAAEELCALLKLSQQETKAVCSNAAIHDWKKRWEHTASPPPENAQKLLKELHARPDLLEATNPDYLEKVHEGKEFLGPLQQISFYLDIITRESDIVPSEERLKEVEGRSTELAAKANGKYWQKTREKRDEVESLLFTQLKAKGCDIASPADIPLMLRRRIEAKWATT